MPGCVSVVTLRINTTMLISITITSMDIIMYVTITTQAALIEELMASDVQPRVTMCLVYVQITVLTV